MTRYAQLNALNQVLLVLVGDVGGIFVIRQLQQRQEHHRIDGRSRIYIFGVFDDAHDLVIAAETYISEVHVLANGILVPEVTADESLIDDGNVGRGRRIAFVNNTSA